jgi:ribonuclease BN (tRNA processing enzyme)
MIIGGLYMNQKIIFLGTGGDNNVVGKQKRASGGIIIKVQGFQFHIDPGPGALVKAKEYGINLRENTALLVSHAHMNHANDINAVISAMTYDGLDPNGVLITTESVVNGYPFKGETVPAILSQRASKSVEKLINIKAGQRVGIENIEILALKTNHLDPYAIGFKFITPDFVLCYSGDTAYANYIIDQYKGTDILILNVVHPSIEKSRINLSTDDAIKILNEVKPKFCIITHFGFKMIESGPIYEVRKIQNETKVQTISAVDGLEIDPFSYSANLKQKTLNLYNH